MTSLKSVNRRVGSLFAVAALVLATVTPGLVPAFASAAQVTERSVALSSSSKAATGVSYTVTFTAPAASPTAGAVVLNFCENSPLIGADCTAPAGFVADAASVTATGYTVAATTADTEDNTIALTGTIGDGAATTIELAGITNPSAAGPLYVRIATYDTGVNALTYTANNLGTGSIDQGSAAVSITDSIGVSGAVLETMTFCVSGAEITGAGCTNSDSSPLSAPTVALGEPVSGGAVALSSSVVSDGSIFSQISTNAASGAVVNLKSSTLNCGGLLRAGSTACDIGPAIATTNGITEGQALFGAKVAAVTDIAGAGGAFAAAGGGTPYYSDSVFKLNFVTGNATGVTSVYGDPFLDTAGAPANNKGVEITFGASAAGNTPAGLYSADLSLIATGKF